MSTSKLNVVFTGFPYPLGMAGTRRNQHAIEVLQRYKDVSVKVIVLRQSTELNEPCGVHNGVPYETVGPDLFRMRFLLTSPIFFVKSRRAIRRAFCPHAKNIFLVYGPPALDNYAMIRQACKCGYKIIFDIVEDDDVAWNISSSLWHKVKNLLVRLMQEKIAQLADGIIVISSSLENKFKRLTRARIPIMLRPISVNIDKFPGKAHKFGSIVKLLYSGSFGTKDGVENLLAAFQQIAFCHDNVRLILTGKSSNERMKTILGLIEASPVRSHIEYKGYLKDEEYFRTVDACDIPCMVRTDSAYANAGFPFKLGEYLASGKPVIVANVSDVRKYLKHKYSAMLVRPGSVDGIVEAVDYLLKHPQQASLIGANGRLVAKHCFDYRSQSPMLYRLLNDIV